MVIWAIRDKKTGQYYDHEGWQCSCCIGGYRLKQKALAIINADRSTDLELVKLKAEVVSVKLYKEKEENYNCSGDVADIN